MVYQVFQDSVQVLPLADVTQSAMSAPTLDADVDELDVITPANSLAVSAVPSMRSSVVTLVEDDNSPPPKLLSRRQSARQQGSRKVYIDGLRPQKSPEPSPAPQKKRPRLSEPADAFSQKKQKREDKKATTVVINARKAKVEASRKRWLLRHRDIFEPLLPSSTFFDHVENDINETDGNTSYVPFRKIECQPAPIQGGEMKEYQLQGLAFLVYMYKNGINSILGDEMGLGKTLQTLSLFAYIKETEPKDNHDPHLIICPLSVLSSWQTEAARWLPSFRTIRMHGAASEREHIKNDLKFSLDTKGEKVDLVLTTYETFVAESSWFKTRRWFYCVLDEGHRVKNAETNLAGQVQGIGALHRLILTGTPLQNNLTELWSLLHFLLPVVFTSASQRLFHSAFDLTKGTYSLPFLRAAQTLLATLMLRRTKASIEAEQGGLGVPPREERTVWVPMTEAQRFWTYRILTRMDTLDLGEIFTSASSGGGVKGEVKGEEVGREEDEGRREMMGVIREKMKVATKAEEANRWRRLMNLLMQLRKICDHPYLLDDAAPEPYVNGEHLVASSSKIIAIDKLLKDILPKGERVLIFSQWVTMLDLLEDFMHLRGIPYGRLDGSTVRARRTLDIKLFQQEKSPYQVFLISTKAGGLGINLTKASTVIMCDSDWNPQNDLQAIARAHRIGQTKVVKVYRLICAGSVEDQMLDRIRRKLFLSVKVMGSTADPSSSPAGGDKDGEKMGTSDVLDILRKGSSALGEAGMELSRFLGASFGEVLQYSKEREDARDAKIRRDVSSSSVGPGLEGVKMEDGVQSEPNNGADDKTLVEDAEAEERRLLSGIAQVQSRLFEGRVVGGASTKNGRQDNKQLAKEWNELQKRARVDRLVTVNGIQVVAENLGQSAPAVVISQQKKKRAKWETEDWCLHCRDGGELVVCGLCPRVFHGRCAGYTAAEVRRLPQLHCSQHECCQCKRKTQETGGMLFRCQTCPQAFCEDCLPEGELDAVGDTLPEFLALGFGTRMGAYYIRCADCHAHWEKNPKARKSWEEEMRETEAKLASMDPADIPY
ncbi:hypothetical protein CONPUDRAFT_169853 [Coniophora puteana RWD-64-598 SS2]|uniref:P-loop containing nucleoside triphosphate hydrolase protein n=1 Tax=Coniophora puteana (strain RWD-64-598) TaxID=741705 RepID=A0A5M3M6L1_CONPW|nr:uncharacterized protein CONPUDRAFT_169853 [Coniophora puteana RWD-64-598 SS2]EIW74988.1 hypothetical protein CONPUDRAFT_169853 [Coniophora puteana RWD-64-598 SS2]